MPLSDILAAIEAEAVADIEQLDEETAASVGQIEADASARAIVEEARAAAGRDGERRTVVTGVVGTAEAENERLLRRARYRLLDRATERVEGALAGLRSDRERFASVTAALLREALDAVPDASEVRCDRRDRQLVGQLVEGTGIEVTPSLESWGGVEVADGAGRTAINTLEARLARAEPELRRITAEWLARQEGESGADRV